MAAPNLINASTINGKTSGSNLTSTGSFTVLNNPASSGKCLKLNTLNVSNYGSLSANITINYNNAANLGGTNIGIAANVSVPAGTVLNIVDKSSQYYLEENTSIGAISGTANTLYVTLSYEDIS